MSQFVSIQTSLSVLQFSFFAVVGLEICKQPKGLWPRSQKLKLLKWIMRLPLKSNIAPFVEIGHLKHILLGKILGLGGFLNICKNTEDSENPKLIKKNGKF